MKLLFLVSFVALSLVQVAAQDPDAMLRIVIEKDRVGRDASGRLPTLPANEHLQRGQIYFENRQFPESRQHFDRIIAEYPTEPAMSGALFLTGRSYYWERNHVTAIKWLERAAREFPDTKEGREGLYFSAACHVRLGKHAEAAKLYEQYITMYPTGERVEGAYTNGIDALREARRYDEALALVARARTRFSGMPTEANAIHAALRMLIYRGRWDEAIEAADEMLALKTLSGSAAGRDEVNYLRAFALERDGRRDEANAAFAAIPDNSASYFSGLASARLPAPAGSGIRPTSSVIAKNFPAPFAADILRESKKRGIDPRFVLAIMKQESSFRPGVKSPSAARGLLQLVIDTALKYNKKAGYPNLAPDDLYQPAVNIAIGCEYLADLKRQFGGLYEAIAASYNGGEDNAARWLARSKPQEPGIFAAEVGFPETKNYVFKVLTNYRIYRDLYDEDLNRR